VSGAQVLAGVDSTLLPAEPFPVQQVGPGELHLHPGAAQVVDRLAVELVDVTGTQQRA
jgi:hypothetical protein